jgi:NAD(P)-dependent dehydrogenase (short-subunit alcohol dehydrogenase family)
VSTVITQNHIIFGGSRGIGKALVGMLRAQNARVSYSSREAGGPPDGDDEQRFVFDAARGDVPPEVIPAQLDGLVYCPGTITLKPFQRLTRDDFLSELNTNLLGAVSAIQACLPALKKSPGASIVLFSTVAVQTGMPFHSSIASAKGAVEGLTRALAAEFAPRVRVNAIAPSLTDTGLAAGLLGSDQKRQAAGERHPLGRIGLPEDAASLALYLLSAAAGWITGQIFHVDGGMGALKTFR